MQRRLLILSLFAALPAHARQATVPDAAPPEPASRQFSPIATGDTVTELDKRIFAVFQARDLAHWFGSDGQGVFRFDGKTLVRFTTRHGLSGDRIRSIQEDRSGNVYVNSEGGISRFDGRGFSPLSVTDPSKSEWKLEHDDLWFTGWQDSGVVYRYDGKLLHRLAFPKTAPGEAHIAKYPRSQFPGMTYSPYDVYTIFKDSKGHVWFGTGTLGACRYDGTSFAWAAKTELGFSEDDGFGVRSIIEDKDGKFWFSRTVNRFAIDPIARAEPGAVALSYRKQAGIGGASDPECPFSFFMSAVVDKNGDLWLATLRGGVWRYDGTSMTHYPVTDGNTPITVFSIYKDRQDALWLGTHEHGVYKWDGKAFRPERL
jgi:Two component regulator propeller